MTTTQNFSWINANIHNELKVGTEKDLQKKYDKHNYKWSISAFSIHINVLLWIQNTTIVYRRNDVLRTKILWIMHFVLS